jgi:ABC-type branched-subunit amino acid transport system permease subunit
VVFAALLAPRSLPAQNLPVLVPIDLTAGYNYNAPGKLVPFHGAITVSSAFRVATGLRIGPALGYVVSDSTGAWVAGGQLDYSLFALFNDAVNIDVFGRVSSSIGRTKMLPVSAGIVATLLGIRTGVVATRDIERDMTALELVFGLEPVILVKVLKAIGGGKRVLDL